MPNEKDSPDKGQESPQSSPGTQGQEGAGEQSEQDAPLVGKFETKTKEDVVRAYQALEKKLGEQGSELSSLRTYQAESQRVLQAVASNPDLVKAVRRELGVPDEDDSAQDEGKFDVARIRKAVEQQTQPLLERERARIIADFEKEQGITELPKEQQTQLRTLVGTELRSFTGQFPTNDRLPEALQKAWKLVGGSEQLEGKNSEGETSKRKAKAGAIGGVVSSGAKSDETVQLTAQQKAVAQKAGISEKDYAETLGRVRETHSKWEE